MANRRAEAENSTKPNKGAVGIATAFALICVAAGVFTILLTNGVKPSEAKHFQIINSFILFGLAVGIFAASRKWFIDTEPIGAKFERNFVFAGVAATIIMSVLIYWCGMRQIGGYDQAPLIDVGYRMINGQRPYIDFPCTLPVAFFLGSKYAFAVFGLEWRSLVVITIIYSIVTFWWTLYLLNNLLANRKLALLMAVTLQAMALILCSYWWYNPITAIAAAVLLFSSANWISAPRSIAATTSQFFAVLLMAAMKPNVGGILVPLVTVALFSVKTLRWRVLIVSVAAFVVFVLLLAVNGISISDMVHGYLAVSDRGLSLKQFLQDLGPNEKVLSLIAFGLVAAPVFVRLFALKNAIRLPTTWVALVGFLAGIYGFLTDGELKVVDLPLVLASSILLGVRPPNNVSQTNTSTRFAPSWIAYFVFLCVALTFASLGQAVTRHRIRAIGPMAFFEYGGTSEVIASGFFKGVRCGPLLIEVNKEITDFL